MNSGNLSQLESHLWEAANILRGPVDAADFKTYVFPLLFFKRISDVHDEEYRAAIAESGGDEEYAQFPQNFSADPWGRNLYGTPPQGRADYAFWQHILLSLAPKTGRCAILFPHGVLFRQEEADMRRKLIEADLIECVLGLGPNLFYNSPMEVCVVICRNAKPKERRKKILFINAVNEVTRERAQSFLTDEHIERIVAAYRDFTDVPGLARAVPLADIRARDGNLSIPLYVAPASVAEEKDATYRADGADGLGQALSNWLQSSRKVRGALEGLFGDKSPKA